MNDSKFCEHGVNVGLENPPVFCGQCPPDTIATLRADLASVRLDYANECDRARRAEARHERDKDELRADLARVEAERDEARAKVDGLSLSAEATETILAVLTDATCSDADDAAASIAHATFLRYAEALGVRS